MKDQDTKSIVDETTGVRKPLNPEKLIRVIDEANPLLEGVCADSAKCEKGRKLAANKECPQPGCSYVRLRKE